jgi:hypothetical protein
MRDCLWVVEEQYQDGWIGWNNYARPTRAAARRLQSYTRKHAPDIKTRIRKYIRWGS